MLQRHQLPGLIDFSEFERLKENLVDDEVEDIGKEIHDDDDDMGW